MASISLPSVWAGGETAISGVVWRNTSHSGNMSGVLDTTRLHLVFARDQVFKHRTTKSRNYVSSRTESWCSNKRTWPRRQQNFSEIRETRSNREEKHQIISCLSSTVISCSSHPLTFETRKHFSHNIHTYSKFYPDDFYDLH